MRIINFQDGFQSESTPLVEPIPASDIIVTPVGNLTEVNVQSALEGVYTKHIDLNENVHGVTSHVVGINDSQTITNKIFAQDLLSGANDTFNIGSQAEKYHNLYLGNNAYIHGSLFTYGAATLFSTDTVGTTKKVFSFNVAGDNASGELSGLIVERSDTHGAMLYSDSLSSKWKCGGLADEREVLTVSHIQTITNKTIDVDNNTITNIENDNIKIGANISRNKLASGNANHVLINDNSGVMSSEQYLDRVRGGTGITSTATFPASGIIVTRGATETLSNKTLASALLSGGSLDVAGAGVFNFLASVGAANINVGSSDSTVVILGSLTVQGTTTFVNTNDLEVTDKNITVNKNGNDASSEGAGLTVDRTSTDGSIIFGNAYASKWACGLVGSEKEIVTVSDSQTLTNKTITNGVLGGTVSGSGVLDQDDMVDNDDTRICTQQSIKAYVDNNISTHTHTFLNLTDTPAAYAGNAAKLLTVNDGVDGVNFRTLQGTTNQVNIGVAAGILTLSLPQNIHSAANPHFASLNLTDGSYKLNISSSSSLSSDKNLVIDTNDKSLEMELGNAEDAQALVYSSALSKWLAGSSGDSSFKIQGIGTSKDIKIKGGLLRHGGYIYITDIATNNVIKSGLGVDIEFDLPALDIEGNAIQNNTNYYLYIDNDSMEFVNVEYTAGQVTAFKARSVKEANFVYSTEIPEDGNINIERFIPIAYFRTNGIGELDTTANSFGELIPRVIQSGGGTGGGAVIANNTYNSVGNHTFTHNKQKKPTNIKMWYFDGGNLSPLTNESYIKNITDNEIYINLDGLTFGSGEYVFIEAAFMFEVVAFPKNEWESNWIINKTTTVFTHNIGKFPTFSLIYDDNGTVKPIDHFSYIASMTKLTVTIDFGSLVIDSTHKLKIKAASSARPTGIIIEPSGIIKAYAGASIPDDYLLCNGASLDTTDYSDLFQAIGYAYGGSGSSFNVPDFRNKFTKGLATSGESLGDTGGSNTIASHTHDTTSNVSVGTHTLTTANLPSHSHVMTHGHADDFVIANDTHNHKTVATANTYYCPTVGAANIYASGANYNGGTDLYNVNTSNDTHNHVINGNVTNFTGSTENTGSATAISHSVTNTTETSTSAGGHDNRPEFVTVNWIIKK